MGGNKEMRKGAKGQSKKPKVEGSQPICSLPSERAEEAEAIKPRWGK